MKRSLTVAALLALPVVCASPALAFQEEDPDAPETEQEEDEGEDDPHADHVVTEHSLTIGGTIVDYEARAGTIALSEEDGTEKADVFFIAYTLKGVDDPSTRPITFCFNGGPGSSSVWLHLGAIGPRRVKMTEEGWAPRPPYELVDNDQSWLDLSDLVFIDPVTTGYSRPAEEVDPGEFHGVDQDVEWVGEFIRLYTTRFERWASPKFLAGESYGTTRAAGLADHLQSRHGMYLNGIVLVSAILNFQTARFDVGNDLPYVLFLPTYTATAWYHGRLDDELQANLQATLNEVENWAFTSYYRDLAMEEVLTDEGRREVAEKLARYTGLSREYVERSNLRIQIGRFTKELLRDQRRTVGRLDSRFKGIDRDAAGERYEFDPSYAAIQGPYTAALNHYVRVELGYENDLPYEILTGRVQPWDYGRRRQNRYLNVAEALRKAMTKNPHLKVFVACGYYDLATPYTAAAYTFGQLQLDPSLSDNVTFGYYESGHMMYIHVPSLVKLKQDVTSFYAGAR